MVIDDVRLSLHLQKLRFIGVFGPHNFIFIIRVFGFLTASVTLVEEYNVIDLDLIYRGWDLNFSWLFLGRHWCDGS